MKFTNNKSHQKSHQIQVYNPLKMNISVNKCVEYVQFGNKDINNSFSTEFESLSGHGKQKVRF